MKRDFCKAAASLWKPFLWVLAPGTSPAACLLEPVLFLSAQAEVSETKPMVTGSFYPHFPPQGIFPSPPRAGSRSPLATHTTGQAFRTLMFLDLGHRARRKVLVLTKAGPHCWGYRVCLEIKHELKLQELMTQL